MKRTILVLIMLLSALFLCYLYLSIMAPDYEPTFTIKEIESINTGEKIYLKKKVWGISSDHHIRVISVSDEEKFEPNANDEYLYKGTTPFFYTVNGDTLKVFVRKASEVPPNFNSKIKVEQIILDNPDMMNLFSEHEVMGINRF